MLTFYLFSSECLPEKMYSCQNNHEKFFTEKKNGYTFFLIKNIDTVESFNNLDILWFSIL